MLRRLGDHRLPALSEAAGSTVVHISGGASTLTLL
jgi:hypothetical protein